MHNLQDHKKAASPTGFFNCAFWAVFFSMPLRICGHLLVRNCRVFCGFCYMNSDPALARLLFAATARVRHGNSRYGQWVPLVSALARVSQRSRSHGTTRHDTIVVTISDGALVLIVSMFNIALWCFASHAFARRELTGGASAHRELECHVLTQGSCKFLVAPRSRQVRPDQLDHLTIPVFGQAAPLPWAEQNIPFSAIDGLHVA